MLWLLGFFLLAGVVSYIGHRVKTRGLYDMNYDEFRRIEYTIPTPTGD